MKIEADGFEFQFTNAVDAFRFDEKDKAKPHFHGLSHAMKAVDLVVELPTDYLFIEVKDFHAADDYDFQRAVFATLGCTDGLKGKRTNPFAICAC